MPFNDDDFVSKKKVGVKLTNKVKEDSNPGPSKEDFDKKVDEIHQKSLSYKERAAELALSFKKIMFDKTLSQNKTVFSTDLEKEVLTKMVSLAIEINNDENEQEGMGSLGWITLCLKYLIILKDRVNEMEYKTLQLQKEISILKNANGLDNTKISK